MSTLKIGIIGCGKIGSPVIQALIGGEIPDCELEAVLASREKDIPGFGATVAPGVFFRPGLDLIIDAATPDCLPAFGEKALALADTWTVNATALADRGLYASLKDCAEVHGHRLRILSGAIAGLDGVSTLAVDKDIRLRCQVDLAPDGEGERVIFTGTVREAAARFPDGTNVAVAVALAGAGLDETFIDVVRPGTDGMRNLAFCGESVFGRLDVSMRPVVSPGQGLHAVAASIIAALQREQSVIWSG